MSRQLKLQIQEPSQTGSARRAAQDLAVVCGLDETEAGRVAIAATELGSNLVKHARGGELLLRPLQDGDARGVELIAVDRGAGMADGALALRDGMSTAGSLGAGLGALSRLATEFDFYTRPGQGTVVLARFLAPDPRPSASKLCVGAICQPKPGEVQCGDDWATVAHTRRDMVVLADGLGHGPDAHKAALVAVGIVRAKAARDPAEVLDEIHLASRTTRGAAVGVCVIEHDKQLCRFAGIGNVACAVVSGSRTRQLASMGGIVGHSVRKINEFTAPWPSGSMLVMHSDGLSTQWDLAAYPGLDRHHPAVIAAVLYRDFSRGRDDVTVVVARDAGAGP